MKAPKVNTHVALILLPLLVYLFSFGFAELVALSGNCFGWWEQCWSRQDSGLYLEISKIGHTLYPCGIENGYEPGSDKWCGNAGWAPFYPFLIYIFNTVSGLPNTVCGVLLSHLFFIAYLYVCAKIIQIKQFNLSNLLTLLLCALCPGGFYFFSIFPLSLMVLLLAIIFWSIQNKKYIFSILPAFLLSLSYSSSIIIFFSFGIYMLYVFFKNRAENKFNKIKSELVKQWSLSYPFKSIFLFILLPGVTGLLTLYLYDYIVTGSWNAMFMVQSKYGHLLYSPFKHLGGHFELLKSQIHQKEAWIHLQNIFLFFTIPVFVYMLIKKKENITPLLVIFTLIMWYIPFSIGINVSLYRSICLLAPILAFTGRFSHLQKVSLLVLFGLSYFYLGKLFILSILR